MLELLPLVLTVATAAAYTAGVVRLRGRGVAWPFRRTVAAAAGAGAVAVAVLPPLGDHDEVFPVHAAQHLLLAMVAPALLALSGPVTLALRTLPTRSRRTLLSLLHSRPVTLLTAPPVALVLDVGGLAVLYLTGLYARTLDDGALHALAHLHVFLAGCLLSWVLVGIDPMPRRPRHMTRVTVLVLAAAAHDTLCKVLYARNLPVGAGPVLERHVGAELMYYGGTVVDVLLAVALMAQWYQATGREHSHELRRATAARLGQAEQG